MKVLIEITQSGPQQYRACCPALPGCEEYGRSPAEVRRQIAQTIRSHLASLSMGFARSRDRVVVEL